MGERMDMDLLIAGHYVMDGDTVIDVGACVGLFTEMFVQAVGEKGYVVAIEPGIKTYQKLCEFMGKYKNVSLRRNQSEGK